MFVENALQVRKADGTMRFTQPHFRLNQAKLLRGLRLAGFVLNILISLQDVLV
jgi:hypothetical protein